MKLDSQRTPKQNSSGHLWMQELAEELNNAGLTVNSKDVLKLPVRWTKNNVKELLFRPVMQALYPDKISTTELTKAEWSEVIENLNLALGERVAIHVPYPTEEEDEKQRSV